MSGCVGLAAALVILTCNRHLALRARPFGPALGVDEFAAEAVAELLGMRLVRKTEDEHVCVVAPEGMGAWAQREVFAEEPDRHVVVAGAVGGRKRNVVRRLPIHRAFAEFAFSVNYGRTIGCIAAGTGADTAVDRKRRHRRHRARADNTLRPLRWGAYRNRVGHIMVRHMCADGLLSRPSPSLGCLKLRPMMSTKSPRLTLAFGSNE